MAKPPETRTWYRVAVAHPGAAPGRAQLFAASGVHMGEAIAAATKRVAGGWPAAVDSALEGDIPLGESVGKGSVVELGDTAVATHYRWPVGVLPKLGDDAGVAGARTGFHTIERPELFVIEAMTDAEHTIDLFMSLIERLPSADNLEVRLLDRFESAATTDVWLTSRVNARKIINFLDDHDEELIGHGHVELSVYVRASKATLRLTEHKTVAWLTEGRALETELAGWLGELHVPRIEPFVSVRDVPHFHYAPASSRSRDRLATELYRQRLRKVATLQPATTPR